MKRLGRIPAVVVSDFDGVYTETGAVFEPYLEFYAESLTRKLGGDQAWYEGRLRAGVTRVREAHELYGWKVGDFIVAPAASDPYVLVRSAATWVCDLYQLFRTTVERDEWQESVFNRFEAEPVPMKPGAPRLLEWLSMRDAYIVSNSSPGPVRGRLQKLVAALASGDPAYGAYLEELLQRTRPGEGSHCALAASNVQRLLDRGRVQGGAKKYLVDAMLHVVNAELKVPGLVRPVLLHRPRYYELVGTWLQEAGATWRDLLVIGDIYELDLALPLELGAQVILVDNGWVQPWERTFLAEHPDARIVTDIADIPALVP